MDFDIERVQNKLRELSKVSLEFAPDHEYRPLHAFPTELRGYSEASLSLSVCKKIKPKDYMLLQASYMIQLGPDVCPRILGICEDCYFMEYLYPAEFHKDSLIVQESFLHDNVWTMIAFSVPDCPELDYAIPSWALGRKCVIHGDPTLDNVLMTKDGFIRITDPIPPQKLRKPSIRAVDHGKIIQSFLGWEVVLRGAPYIAYEFPQFMCNTSELYPAVFWAKVSLNRIAFRDMSHRITLWATRVGNELEELCASLY